MLQQAAWSLENSFTKFLSWRLQPRRPGYFPGQVSWLTEPFTFTEPSQPQACRIVSARRRVSGSGLLFEARRLLEPPGEVFSAYSGGGHAGFSPASLSRLPLSIEGVSTRKALCYSMKISDGSQIEGLARLALLLVCAGLPRASGLGANAITRMVYLFPSRPRPG